MAYAITNIMENLRFDKEDYFHVLVFYGLFYKRNRKSFFSFRGSLGELEIVCKHSHYGARVPTSISRSLKLPLVFYNSMETQKMFSIS